MKLKSLKIVQGAACILAVIVIGCKGDEPAPSKPKDNSGDVHQQGGATHEPDISVEKINGVVPNVPLIDTSASPATLQFHVNIDASFTGYNAAKVWVTPYPTGPCSTNVPCVALDGTTFAQMGFPTTNEALYATVQPFGTNPTFADITLNLNASTGSVQMTADILVLAQIGHSNGGTDFTAPASGFYYPKPLHLKVKYKGGPELAGKSK